MDSVYFCKLVIAVPIYSYGGPFDIEIVSNGKLK